MALKIAFGHRAQTGKDTACSVLKNSGAVQLSFAQPLYDLLHHCQRSLGFPEEKDREFLQFVGTEWARKKDSDVWARLLAEKVKRLEAEGAECICVSDLRFPNEASMLKKLGFTLIKVDRPKVPFMNHASETALDSFKDWDYYMTNDKTLQDFKMAVISLKYHLEALKSEQ